MESTGYYHHYWFSQVTENKLDRFVVKGWYPGVIVVAK